MRHAEDMGVTDRRQREHRLPARFNTSAPTASHHKVTSQTREKNVQDDGLILSEIVEFRNGESDPRAAHIGTLTQRLLGAPDPETDSTTCRPRSRRAIVLASALRLTSARLVIDDKKIPNKPGRLDTGGSSTR